MKTEIKRASLFLRLGLTAIAVLLGQQALAAGTLANTPVLNRATVGYSVNLVPQTTIESSPTGNSTPGVGVPGAGEDTEFVVDRRVDFQLDLVQTTLTQVNVGQTQQVVEYLLTNNSNSALDFALDPQNAADASNTGRAGDPDDNADVTILSARVSAKSTQTAPIGPGPDPTLTDAINVINLAPDDSIRIFVFSDIPGTLADGSVANIALKATAAEPNTAAATLLVEVATDGLLTVENVWTAGPVAAGSNYDVTTLEGYEIASAALTVTKSSSVFSDPINGQTAPKAIPGAIVEYSIAIVNAGAQDATGIVITDTINGLVTFVADAYGTNQDIRYDIDGGADSFCDATDGNATDCDLSAGVDLTVGGTGLVLDVAAGETLTVSFQVLIPAP